MCYCDVRTLQTKSTMYKQCKQNSRNFDKKVLVIKLDPPKDFDKSTRLILSYPDAHEILEVPTQENLRNAPFAGSFIESLKSYFLKQLKLIFRVLCKSGNPAPAALTLMQNPADKE